MGGATITSCIDEIDTSNLKKVILFAPALATGVVNLAGNKLPIFHQNMHQHVKQQQDEGLLFGGKGPLLPALYNQMKIAHEKFVEYIKSDKPDKSNNKEGTKENEDRAKLFTLVRGDIDQSVNTDVFNKFEKDVDIIRNPYGDHGPHMALGCGGMWNLPQVMEKIDVALHPENGKVNENTETLEVGKP